MTVELRVILEDGEITPSDCIEYAVNLVETKRNICMWGKKVTGYFFVVAKV